MGEKKKKKKKRLSWLAQMNCTICLGSVRKRDCAVCAVYKRLCVLLWRGITLKNCSATDIHLHDNSLLLLLYSHRLLDCPSADNAKPKPGAFQHFMTASPLLCVSFYSTAIQNIAFDKCSRYIFTRRFHFKSPK